jgi:SAM-dependent methyltransferase
MKGGTESQNSELLEREYRRRFQDLADYRRKVWAVLCQDYFSSFVEPHSTVLDVGCGWGEFINQIDAAKKYAIDLNPDTRTHLGSEVQFFHQDCSTCWPLEDESLDVVFSSNFIEHLHAKSQVESLIQEAFRTLKPGGKFVLLGPNIRYLPGAYWDFWDHRLAISDASLVEVLELSGFRILKRLARFLPYTMSGGRQAPIGLLRAYLKLPIFWPLLGKQFLVVGQKAP